MSSLIKRGLVIIGGAKNVGKSILASTILPPSEAHLMVVHDGENSMDEIVANMSELQIDGNPVQFGSYLDLSSLGGDPDEILERTLKGKFPWKDEAGRSSMEAYFHRTVQAIRDLPSDTYKVYVHETADKLEAAIYAYAVKHSGVGVRDRDSNFWLDAMYPVYEGLFALLRSKGIEVIVLTAHLKNSSVRKGAKTVVVPNKLELAVKPRIYKDSALMLILVQDPENGGGEPAALVLKERLPRMTIGEDGQWKVRRMLPRRIPCCVWRNGNEPMSSIEWYMTNGADLVNPGPRETWNDFEKEVFGEFLNSAQMRMMITMDERDVEAMRGTQQTVNIGEQKDLADLNRLMDSGLSQEEAIESIVSELPTPLRAGKREALAALLED